MSFDPREKNGGLIRVVQEMRIVDHELSLTKGDNRGKNKFGAPRPHSRQRLQCFCDKQELGIDSGIGPFCKNCSSRRLRAHVRQKGLGGGGMLF